MGPGLAPDHYAHQDAAQDSGEEPSQEQAGNGDIGHGAVDDEGDARWDDGPDDGAGRGDRGGVFRLVAFIPHCRDHDSPDGGGIGRTRASDAGEEHRGHDGNVGQAPPHAPDEQVGEADDPLGDPAGVHDVPCQDEEGHREDQEGVQANEEALREQDQR